MVNDFRHASVIEGVRFTAQVGLPNVVQGLFKKRELPTKVAAIAKAEAQGHALVAGLVERLGTDPFYVRVATDYDLPVTPDGKAYTIGRNVFTGNSEFAGAVFSPDGEVLFVNIMYPGITLAIRGPWTSVRT